MDHVQPPKVLQEREAEEKDTRSTFVEMGFPIKHLALSAEDEEICSVPCPWCVGKSILLTCSHKKVLPPPFCYCPRCKARQCNLPTTCTVCGLTLVSSSDLSQSYHHLFPIPPFEVLEVIDKIEEYVTWSSLTLAAMKMPC
jgi:hypothetical protein